MGKVMQVKEEIQWDLTQYYYDCFSRYKVQRRKKEVRNNVSALYPMHEVAMHTPHVSVRIGSVAVQPLLSTLQCAKNITLQRMIFELRFAELK